MMPWKLLSSAEAYIFNWLVGYSALLGPTAGIMIADYWILRRRELAVADLYLLDGRYGRVNWSAMAALALGVAPTFWTAFVVVGVFGARATGYQSLSNTLALSLSDEGHRGRVQSLLMLSFAGFGIAALPLGLLAEAIGLRPAIVLMGVVATFACAAYALTERSADESVVADVAVSR